MSDDPGEILLKALRFQGRCSPEVKRWGKFYDDLRRLVPTAPPPPKPLILAASGEPAASKFERLGEQLEWARGHQCLSAALAMLNGLPEDGWETQVESRWHASSYWRP